MAAARRPCCGWWLACWILTRAGSRWRTGRSPIHPHGSACRSRSCIGLVFQDYALWPHLTVRQHLSFPLELRRIRGSQATARIDDLLRLVRLDGLGERLPGQLSGGQQQRVALARALAADAQLLLL